MSARGASSGSQAAAASQSVGSRPRPAANSATATQPSDSATLASDSATVGNPDVVEVEVEDDAPAAKKRKLRSEVWKDFDLISVNGVWKAKWPCLFATSEM